MINCKLNNPVPYEYNVYMENHNMSMKISDGVR